MSNPLDALAVARDLVRRDEAEHLHRALHDLYKEVEALSDGRPHPQDREDFLRGLDEAMLILDARIGLLRERWE
jgi:hypothetical protein